MSEASRARVTITLGRSGQVVKRPVSDVGFSDSFPGAGSKRSVRDRLGSSLDGTQVHNKRQRGDGYISSLGTNGVDDVRIGKNDLRLKLMQKNVVRRAQSDDDRKFMDLREKLSRSGQPPHSNLDTRQRMPESRETSNLDTRRRMPESRETSNLDTRQRMPESRETSNLDTRQCMPESRETSILGRIPVSRSTNDLPLMNSSRSSYSAWTLDHIRRRSPERIVGSSRGLSPTRNVEDLQRRPISRAYDGVRAVPYMSKDVHNVPRPMTSTPYMTKPTLAPGSVKPLPPAPQLLGQLPPPPGIMQKSSYTGEEQLTVDGLLHSLGLGKYAILFKAEEVDMTALKQMGENDLKELGIPMGPRKKILLSLLPRSKRQP